jgi:hypothetical protein
MGTLVDFFQFALLVAIIAAWYFAKRDLTAAAALRQSPAVAEMKELRETVEQLIGVLEQRAAAAEKRLATLIAFANQAVASERPSSAPARSNSSPESTVPESDHGSDAAPSAVPSAPPSPPNRYQQVYDLEDAGVTEPAEIARQTGLGLAEVSLVLSLRPR